MFIDEAIITVTSGKGGDGAVHFRREKYVPRGGPDGGDGGHGGSVILEVVPTLNTLAVFRYKPKYRAEDGKNGAKQKMSGRSAEDLVIPVPPGTVVYEAKTEAVIGDLVEAGQRLVVCQGGRGGRGNQHFATAVNQVPRMGERGEPGQTRQLRLELKLIADVGIVGAPNAGKSTLLAALTSARPKVAPYPFTTIEPNLGVAQVDAETDLVLADIPGLIEGAHLGIGLGHDFLRHVQRTRVLIHVLDGSAPDPLLDYAQINSELALFDPLLAKKPVVVAVNKMDMPEVQARWPELEAGLKKHGVSAPMSISAAAGTNLRTLLNRAAALLKQAPAVETLEPELVPVYRPESDPRHFTIQRERGGWRVRGEAIERAAAMTYWEYDQSVRRFQRILQALGIEDALRESGVQEGETVYIGEYELEWSDENKGEQP